MYALRKLSWQLGQTSHWTLGALPPAFHFPHLGIQILSSILHLTLLIWLRRYWVRLKALHPSASARARRPRVSAGLFQSLSMADFHQMTSWELSECGLREGGRSRGGGAEEGRGLRTKLSPSRASSRPFAPLPARRSAPPATDKRMGRCLRPGMRAARTPAAP